MGIDFNTEPLIRLADVPKLKNLPNRRSSKRVAISTVWRWSLRGVHGIRLETLKVGGTLCTSVAALQRFFDAVTERDNPTPASPFSSPAGQMWLRRTPAARRRAIAEAERRLDEAGIR